MLTNYNEELLVLQKFLTPLNCIFRVLMLKIKTNFNSKSKSFIFLNTLHRRQGHIFLILNFGYSQCQGDANLDDTINIQDVILIVNHILDIELLENHYQYHCRPSPRK